MNETKSLITRRRFLKVGLLTMGAIVGVSVGGYSFPRPRIANACRAPALGLLDESLWLRNVWEGLDPHQVWDCHAHLAGVGDSDSGIKVGPKYDRLLNGSDYPLPGIVPLTSPAVFASHGLLPQKAVDDLKTLREHNPLYFDLALKRHLSWNGQSFPARVFETRGFFEEMTHE